jgi:hypothetical protein
MIGGGSTVTSYVQNEREFRSVQSFANSQPQTKACRGDNRAPQHIHAASSFALVVFLILCSTEYGRAQDPTCSPGTTPAQCTEAQITDISKIFGEKQQIIASMRDELNTAKAEIATLKDRVSTLEANTKTLAQETELIRPGGPGCVLARSGPVLSGWQTKGTFGVIQYRPVDGGRSDAFQRGGGSGGDWWWEHGDIICPK